MSPAASTQGRVLLRTPENVEIPFDLAANSTRAGAFFIDMTLLGLGLGLLTFMLSLATATSGEHEDDGFLSAFALLALFLARNFYFTFSELFFQGQTFGKKRLGLRVIAKDGGPVSTEMIVVRNLTRDVELFLPLSVFFVPELVFGDSPGLGRLVSLGWMISIALLPIFNRHHARAGDLIAGTIVVMTPKATLLPDLVRNPQRKIRGQSFDFKPEQLDVYGIKELQVLEDVLRQHPPDEELMGIICEKIKRKIKWNPKQWDVPPEPFLRAFYEAQRRRLEHKMLLGKRQERKVR